MIPQPVTVGTSAAQVPLAQSVQLGAKLLARTANAGDVYLGTTSAVTTSTGTLVAKGVRGATEMHVVPAQHFAGGGQVWLVASQSGQIVDVESQ